MHVQWAGDPVADDEVAGGLAALRALDDEDLAAGEAELVLRHLLVAGVLGKIAALAERQLEPTPEPAAPPGDGAPAGGGETPVGAWLPPLAELAPRLRRQAVATARRELRAALRPGAVILVADAGDRAARHALADELSLELAAGLAPPAVRIDAVADPMLQAVDAYRDDDRPLLLIDADVAPRLVEFVAEGRGSRRTLVIVVPGDAFRALGEALAPDLALSVPAGADVALDGETATAETLDAALALRRQEATQPRLPGVAALAEIVWAFVAQAAAGGSDGARAIIAVCQRLIAYGDRAVVRRALADRWPDLRRRIDITEPHHALAWGRLLRDAGLATEAEAVLIDGVRTFPADLRLRHALRSLKLRDHDPTPAELVQLADLLLQVRQQPANRGTASYFAHALARAQRRAGDLPAAADTIAFALGDDPDNVVLLVEAGLIAAARENWLEVERHFLAAHLRSPRSGVILNAWGRSVAAGGTPDRAERLLARALALEPWNARHTLELAHLAKDRGLLTEAEDRLLPLLDDPDPATARRVRVELADVLIEAGPGRWEDAAAVLDDLELLDEQPGADGAARLTGLRLKLLAARGEHRAVERLLSGTDHPYLLTQEAAAILAQADPRRATQAEARLDRLERLPAARADPATGRVERALRARAALLRGDVARARQIMTTVAAAAPPLPVVLNALADVEAIAAARATTPQAAKESGDRAEALRRTALAADPRNAYTHRALAAHLAADRPADARRHFRYAQLAGLPARPVRDYAESL